jgi:Type VI secretion system/phage-baseplate injector OB domain
VSTYGKYRGVVQNNIDPMRLGRVQALVPDVSQEPLGWALPCLPCSGPHAIPAVGASIWVEFEGGDIEYPIWSGCFWSAGEAPPFEMP